MRNANLIRRRRTPLVGWYQRILNNSGLQALYDPSDLTSIYQSRTGGSTGAVDSVVGIMLDKSEMGGKTAAAFIEGQSDVLAGAGNFASVGLTGWTVGASDATHKVTAVSGGLRFEAPTASPVVQLSRAAAWTAGQWYEVTMVVSSWTSGTLKCDISGQGGVFGSGVGTFKCVGYAANSQLNIYRNSAPVDMIIESISIRHLPGYHALAPSDAARGILKLSADPTIMAWQTELLSNGTFDSATTGWTGVNATLASVGGQLVITTTAASPYAYQAITTIPNQYYQIKVTYVTDATTGNAFIYAGTLAGMGDLLNVNIGSTVGTYTVTFKATGTTTYITFSGSASAIAANTNTIDDFSVKQIPASAYRYYLNTDGVDDWMNVFPTLDLGATWWHVGGWTLEANGTNAFALSSAAGSSAYKRNGTGAEWLNSAPAYAAVHTGNPTNTHVVTLEHSGYAGTLAGRYNGGGGASLTPYNYSAETKALALFSRSNAAWNTGLDGRFYGGAFGTGTLTSTDRALLERYVAGLTGVTL